MNLTKELEDLIELLTYLKMDVNTILAAWTILEGKSEETVDLLNYIIQNRPTESQIVEKLLEIAQSTSK